jgi:hypothetical protein
MAPRDCHDNWRGALSLCSIRSEGSNRPKQMSFSSSARSAASARTGPIATARPTTSSSRRLTAWLGRYVRGRGWRARRSRVWRKFCWTRNMMLPRTNYVPPPSRNPVRSALRQTPIRARKRRRRLAGSSCQRHHQQRSRNVGQGGPRVQIGIPPRHNRARQGTGCNRPLPLDKDNLVRRLPCPPSIIAHED